MDVALHVTLGHLTAGAGLVLPGSPSAFCTCSLVPVNTALLWGSFQHVLSAVLSVHLAWSCKESQESKILSLLLWGDQERTALLG